ncbi:MarR family winged helix-turn-helix transcriptional regulator [Chryseobacterium sp. A301]
MKTTSKEKSDNIDLILKSTWLAVSKMYSDMASEYDSTAVQALTLLKIDPKDGTRSTNLGPKMAIEPTSLTRIVKLLEDNGYIYKEKTQHDKREVIIKLTEKGLQHRDISKDVVLNFNQIIVDTVDKEKLDVFREVMSTILRTAKQLNNKKK